MKLLAAVLLFPLTFSACSPAVDDAGSGTLLTGLNVESPLAATEVQLVAPDGSVTRIAANAIHEVPPGEYRVTHVTSTDFVFANRLVVVEGAVTTLSLGALDLRTLPGATRSTWSVFAQDRMLIDLQGANEPVAVPPGLYRLKDSFATDFVYAEAVNVQGGSISVVPMGAIRLAGSHAEACSEVAIYRAAAPLNAASLRARDSANVLITVPPGTFQIRDQVHDTYVFFDHVAVTAGQVTDLAMGTIPPMAESYDLYAAGCATKLASYHAAHVTVAAPVGGYCLKRYYTDEVIAQVLTE